MAEMSFPLDNTVYSADEFQLYMSTRNSGVYANEDFMYSLGYGLSLVIGKGRAWLKYGEFNGLAYANTANKVLYFANADPLLPRLDRVVIQYNRTANNVVLQVKTGIASNNPAPPAVVKTADIYELSLYQIKIAGGSNAITANDIIDERLDKNLCGLMGDSVTQISTQDLKNKLDFEIDKNRQDLQTYKQQEQELFDSWFASIQNILDGDVAGNLANRIETLTTKVDSITDEKIKQLAGENISSSSYTFNFNSTNYDYNNLYNAEMNIDANSGILAWANWSHSFYKIEKQAGKIIFYANADFSGNTINYVLFKNSNVAEFIGAVAKNPNIIIQTNTENQTRLITKNYGETSVTYKSDRVETRYSGQGGRELIATKLINIGEYSRIRMYGKFISEPSVGDNLILIAGYFGVLKPDVINNISAVNPYSAFWASKRIADINSTGYLELDISSINGEYNIGAFGYSAWDTYKFELLK